MALFNSALDNAALENNPTSKRPNAAVCVLYFNGISSLLPGALSRAFYSSHNLDL